MRQTEETMKPQKTVHIEYIVYNPDTGNQVYIGTYSCDVYKWNHKAFLEVKAVALEWVKRLLREAYLNPLKLNMNITCVVVFDIED